MTASRPADEAASIKYDLIRLQAIANSQVRVEYDESGWRWGVDPDRYARELEDAELSGEFGDFMDQLEGSVGDEDLRSRYLADPSRVVIDEITRTTARIAELRREQALLVAYAREFVPDPPRQAEIAAAAQVSRTQVGRMYGDEEVRLLADVLNLQPPRAAREALRHRTDVPGLSVGSRQ